MTPCSARVKVGAAARTDSKDMIGANMRTANAVLNAKLRMVHFYYTAALLKHKNPIPPAKNRAFSIIRGASLEVFDGPNGSLPLKARAAKLR